MNIPRTDSNRSEFRGQIVDIFEDYLSEHDLNLVNAERHEAILYGEIDENDAAIIYGDHYDYLADEIDFIIDNQNSFSLGFEKEVNRIMDTFLRLIIVGHIYGPKPDELIPFTDMLFLKDKVKETFNNWIWKLCEPK